MMPKTLAGRCQATTKATKTAPTGIRQEFHTQAKLLMMLGKADVFNYLECT